MHRLCSYKLLHAAPAALLNIFPLPAAVLNIYGKKAVFARYEGNKLTARIAPPPCHRFRYLLMRHETHTQELIEYIFSKGYYKWQMS